MINTDHTLLKFAHLKSLRPGQTFTIRQENGELQEVILVRRGRQNARVKLANQEESFLIGLDQITT